MSTVIKSQPGVPSPGQVFSLGDIALEAQAITDRARRQAESLLAQARQEGERIRQEAARAGRDEGLVAGRAEGAQAGQADAARQFEQQLTRAVRMLGEAIESLNARRAQMLAEARRDLVALALAAAEKIVRRSIAADPDVARRTVESAVELAGRASRLAVQVNAADLETVRGFAGQLVSRLTDGAEVQVVAGEDVEPGGCRVLSWRQTGQSAEIDATIQTQLTRLAAELLGGEDQ